MTRASAIGVSVPLLAMLALIVLALGLLAFVVIVLLRRRGMPPPPSADQPELTDAWVEAGKRMKNSP